jgi:hypothetical protein
MICERDEAVYDNVRKAMEDGRVRSDWYEKWGWRNGADEDAILYNWESYAK